MECVRERGAEEIEIVEVTGTLDRGSDSELGTMDDEGETPKVLDSKSSTGAKE